jgi:hypothetical protein
MPPAKNRRMPHEVDEGMLFMTISFPTFMLHLLGFHDKKLCNAGMKIPRVACNTLITRSFVETQRNTPTSLLDKFVRVSRNYGGILTRACIPCVALHGANHKHTRIVLFRPLHAWRQNQPSPDAPRYMYDGLVYIHAHTN